MDDLKPIRVFLAVAEHLSFSRAAKALHLTPASVTRIIAQLEQDLGQQLLVRTTRQVSLTGAGAMVAARFRPIVADFAQATTEITEAARPHVGRLRISAPMSLGLRMMPAVMTAYRAAYPEIALEVQLTDTLVDVISESCDLAIRISRAPTDKSTIWRKLVEVPLIAIAAPDFAARHGPFNAPSDISQHQAMSYSSDSTAETWAFQKGTLRETVRAGTQILSNNGEFLYAMARDGAGICVLPDFLVARGLEDGVVVQLLPEWTLPPLWLTLFYPPYQSLPPVVAGFTAFFERFLHDYDRLDWC